MRRARRSGSSPFAVGAIVLAVAAAVTYLSFTKDIPLVNEPYEITAAFRDTSGLAPNSPVRIAGVEVGEVTKVEHTSPGAQSATVTMAILDKGRPIHTDASAKVRPRIFLEGNFFVDLRPGSPDTPELDDGEGIGVERTANPVQFDEVLQALRSDTRNDLSEALRQLGRSRRAGGASAFNRSLEDQPDAYRYSAVVSEALLGTRPRALGDWVRDQGRVARALDADPVQLRSLVVDFSRTAAALADREADLRAAVDELPSTLKAGLPALGALNDAFPDVRRFATAARPGVRSTGPAVDELLPLVKQLRGLVGADELRGLSEDVRGATPPLARLSRDSLSVLEELRAASSCTNEVLVPTGNDKLTDDHFPATGPVHEEFGKFLPNLAGESRSFDANGQFFKVLGTGGAETLNLGNGLFGSVLEPIVGVNPPTDRSRPPLRPEVPCETQERPDLRTDPGSPPPTVGSSSSRAAKTRSAKAQNVAVELLRRQLKLEGRDLKVLERPITLDEIRRLAAKNGLTRQLDKVLRRGR